MVHSHKAMDNGLSTIDLFASYEPVDEGAQHRENQDNQSPDYFLPRVPGLLKDVQDQVDIDNKDGKADQIVCHKGTV